MRKILQKSLSLILATSLVITSVDLTAFAKVPSDVESEITVLNEEEENELKESLHSAVSEESYPGGVFGFYETILNAKEGDELYVSVVRQGSTDTEASVVFKAIDISAEYGKDYTISVEKGLFGDKFVPALDGVRPLVEDYGEIATQEELETPVTIESTFDSEKDKDESDEIEVIDEEEPELNDKDEKATDDSTSSLYNAGGNSLGNLYSLQTGEDAPNYDWKEYSTDNVSEETKEAMEAGWDESRENLAALPGVTVKLRFAPLEYKKDIKVKIKDDSKSESGEVVLFELQDAEGAEIGDSYNGYLNIADNDSKEQLTYSVKEKEIRITPEDYIAAVTIQRHSGIDQMDFVSVGTEAVDAEPDVDYRKTVTELFFASGITERTIEIPITSNREKESHFWVGLTSANGTVEGNNACYVTIEADPNYETKYEEVTYDVAEDTSYFDSEESGADYNAVPSLGAPAQTEVTVYSNSGSVHAWSGTDMKKICSVDLRNADYVKVNYHVWGYTYNWLINNDREKKVELCLWDGKRDIQSRHVKEYQPPESDSNRVEYGEQIWTRGDSENWNYKNATIWYAFSALDGTHNDDVNIVISSVVVGYNKYKFTINNNYNGMGQYQEKKYKAKDSSDLGNIVKYQKVYFNDAAGKQSTEINITSGDTVSTSRLSKGDTPNSQGVYAEDSTVNFKGFKIIKPSERGVLSNDLLPASFTVDNSFKVKYKDYMYSNGTFELVPIYEPKKITVTFNNINAAVSGKADVKGQFNGFKHGAVQNATMLDSLNIKGVANNGYGITSIALEKPAVYYYTNTGKRFEKYVTVSNNLKQDSPNNFVTALNFSGYRRDFTKNKNYYSTDLRITINYDASSITLAPSPQSKNNAKYGNILYVDSVVTSESGKEVGKMVKGGNTFKLEGTSINMAYTFGSVPETGYHTFWKDGTLDRDGDGIVNDDNPFYKSFQNSYGQSIRYVTQIPLSKIYYNFVKEIEVSEDLYPIPIRGWVKLKDRMLISGTENTVGLNGISVYSDGIEAQTKYGEYGNKKGDGYYELDGNGHFYDVFNYAVTFNGHSDYGDVATMAVQSPGVNKDIIIETWKDVEVTDVRLFQKVKNKKDEYEYQAADTSGVKSGYYGGFTDGDYDYRIQMTAHRNGVNIDKAEISFYNKDGGAISIEGVQDSNQSGIFTFDFNPANKGIKAGATARVTFSSGETKFLSRDVGILIKASLGVVNIVNFLTGGDSRSARIDIIGAVNSAIDMGWSGNVDNVTVTGDSYEDQEGNKVIKVGIGKNIVDKATKDPLLESARTAAESAKAVGKANSKVAKLESKHSKANDAEKEKLEKEIAAAKKELEDKKKEAADSKQKFDDKFKDAQKPKKNSPKFGNSFTMDLGFSFLMTFGYDYDIDQWYFKNMILTGSLKAAYKFSMNYATPVGVTLGIGLTLNLDASASFVVEQRFGFEDNKDYRYYIASGKNLDVLDSDGDDPDRKLDNRGLFSINPSITLTLSAGIAGDLVKVDVSGTAAFNMVFGTKSDSAGSCTLSASIKISALIFSFSKELANKTFQLWGDENVQSLGSKYSGQIIEAISESGDSFLYESIDAFEAEDVSYMASDLNWYGGSEEESASFNAIDEGGQEAYRESPLADKIAANADFNMVSLGNGTFAAVFLNVPKNRINNSDNAKAAYYTYYDGGSWSVPEILEDDQTLDQYPRIYSLGSKGAFIVWSSVNTDYKDTDNKLERQNALDIHGRFVKPDGSLADNIEEITKTTQDKNGKEMGFEISDFAADKTFGIFTSEDKMVVCYEKRQYANKTSDATVGDMMYPVSSLIATRVYDFSTGSWAEGTESLDSLPGLLALGTEKANERVKAYNENVYGQKFANYLPKVILKEDLEENNGYYRSGGTGTTAIKLEDSNNGLLLDSDAIVTEISGQKTGVLAYTVDADGNMDTLSDRQLYMITYDMDKAEFSEPIILTGYEINSQTGEAYTPESSNPKFVNAQGGLYLLWLRRENILGLNVTYLIENQQKLIKTGTYDGVSYRYIDKTHPSDDIGIYYKAPKQLVSGRIADTEDSTGTVTGDIHEFEAATDGKYIYIVWPESAEKDPEKPDDSLIDTQMWCVRVETIVDRDGKLSYTTNPVQITSYPENNYDDITFDVIDGKMVGLARKVPSRLITEAEAIEIYGDEYSKDTFVPYAVWDDEGAYPVSFWVDPASVAKIKNEGIYDAVAGEGAAFSFEVLNDGFDDLTGAKVSATDKYGNSLLEEKEVTVPDLIGGSRTGFAGYLPLDKSAKDAEVFITLKTKDGVRTSTTLHKDLSPDLSVQKLSVVETGERGLYRVTGVVDNTGSAVAESGNVQIYVKKDDTIRNLERVSYPALAPGESYDIDVIIEVADEDFTEESQIVDITTGEVLDEIALGQKAGTQVTETLKLYASYIEDDETIEQAIYQENVDDEVKEFITRNADPQEMNYIDAVTGVTVEAIKAVERDGETTAEAVSAGKGLITLEKGERVNLRTAIESNLAGKGFIKDEDGNVIGDITGAENLTYRYEFVGEEGYFDKDGWFIADKAGTGKLKVYVYPADREYNADNYIRLGDDELEGQYSFARMSEGFNEDTFDDYPAKAIKTFTLDLEVLEVGERDSELDYTYFTDSKGIIYRKTSKTEVAVCGLDGNKSVTNLSIPATVKTGGKTYKVTRIDANAFMNNKLLKSVTIGKNVKDIRSNAFSGCTALSKVKFGSSVENICDAAFKDCTALKNFTLPSKLKKIYDEAFMDCDSITSVTIPAKVIYIGEKAFYGCDKLSKITIKAENLAADQMGRYVFGEIAKGAVIKFTMKNAETRTDLTDAMTEEGETFKDKKGITYKLISVENRTVSVLGLTTEAKLKLKRVAIPQTIEYMGKKYIVTAVEKNAFAENDKLTSVTLPKTLLTIKDGAFKNAIALKSLKLPASVLKVGDEAFRGCIALNQVTIAGADTKFGTKAFYGVPDKTVFNVTTKNKDSKERIIESIIGDTASFTDGKNNTYDIVNVSYREASYTGNKTAKTISVPDTVKYRGAIFEVFEVSDLAFTGNTQITSVSLGKNVYGIGKDAFKGCTSLKKVSMKNVYQIDDEAFAGCSALSSLSLSNSVEYIGVRAFTECTSLKSVTIPKNIRTIDDEAFYKCSSLKTVTIKSEWLMEVGLKAFEDNHPSAKYKISKKKNLKAYKQLLIDSGVPAGKIK